MSRQGQAPGVLVVDEDPHVLTFTSLVLFRQGFRVIPASSGEEAVALYTAFGPAVFLVLLDVGMPGLDGPATLRALRDIDPSVRCCFFSGGWGRYTGEELRALGAEAVFPKPISADELGRALWGLYGPPAGGAPQAPTSSATRSPTATPR